MYVYLVEGLFLVWQACDVGGLGKIRWESRAPNDAKEGRMCVSKEMRGLSERPVGTCRCGVRRFFLWWHAE